MKEVILDTETTGLSVIDGHRIVEIGCIEIENYFKIPSDDNSGREIKNLNGTISLQDIQFQYPSTKNPVFESLSLSIEPGQIVSLVGYNGSGKSTLIKILANVLEISRGKIQIEDIDLGQLSKNWFRRQIILSPQEPTFIDGSLRDNILGESQIDSNQLVKILKEVDLLNYVNHHEKGINMSLDDRGENLPVGIRKRISLEPEKAIFCFIDDIIPSTNTLMTELYDKHCDEDGFLYVFYTGENTFGC